MKRLPCLVLLFLGMFYFSAFAQKTATMPSLSLDSCRTMALQHNKGIRMAQLAVEKARHEHNAARTNYLPKLSATAAYTHLGERVSLLNNDQKNSLSHLGTHLVGAITPEFAQMAQGLIAANPGLAPLIQRVQAGMPAMAGRLNAVGRSVVDAFDTDTRNVAVGAIVLTQPLYMGGKIRAYDRITHYSEQLAGERLRADEQELVLEVDKAYWQVVSLVNKQKLATAYRDMLARLHSDVEKMMAQGLATRANELAVSVELNKAEMTLTKVDDGLTLSRMLLAQLCGWALTDRPTLTDELLDDIAVLPGNVTPDEATALTARPELRQLRLATQIYGEKVKIERAAFLPTLALTAGVLGHYPSLSNGFERKLNGTWNVSVALKVPLWNWGEGRHKVAAARAEARMAALRAEEVGEKITLQVHQGAFAVNEANRKLGLSQKSLDKAEENLRMSKLGFDEGMISTSDLLAAQTAWLAAHSDKIDAQIDIMLTRAAYAKALGK